MPRMKAVRRVMERVMIPVLFWKAPLLLVELARYLRAEAANTVEVLPSSLISITMAPEVTIVWPAELETPVETEEMTMPVIVDVEVEVEVTVKVDALDTVSVLALLLLLALALLERLLAREES